MSYQLKLPQKLIVLGTSLVSYMSKFCIQLALITHYIRFICRTRCCLFLHWVFTIDFKCYMSINIIRSVPNLFAVNCLDNWVERSIEIRWNLKNIESLKLKNRFKLYGILNNNKHIVIIVRRRRTWRLLMAVFFR